MVLHVALQFGSLTLVERIFQLADEKLTASERLELIQTESIENESILRQSGKNLQNETMDIVCNFLLRQSDLFADVKALLMKKEDNKYNFLSYAASRNRCCLLIVLNWFKEQFSHDDFQAVILERKRYGLGRRNNLAYQVADFCDENLSKNFFDFCLSSFDKKEVKEIILADLFSLFDALEFSLYNPSSAVVSVVWNVYIKVLNETELENLLFEGNQGREYFEMCKFKSKNREAVEKLSVFITALYGKDKMLTLIR